MDKTCNEPDLLDYERLTSLVELLGTGLREVTKEYLLSSEKRINELISAKNDMNYLRMAKIVHTLKGSSANIGLHRLATMCEILEIDALNNCIESIPRQVIAIQDIHPRTCQALIKFIDDNIAE